DSSSGGWLMSVRAAAWAVAIANGVVTGGAAGYSGTSLTMSFCQQSKRVLLAFLAAMLRARRMRRARGTSMWLRTRALTTSMSEAWMACVSSKLAMGWRRDLGGVRTPRIIR